jgi:hypothetical protein
MPELKQPPATARAYSNIYFRKRVRWLRNLIEALTNGRKGYLLAVNTVLDECLQIANELSTLTPGILKLLSPRLVLLFGQMMLQPLFWDAQIHLSLCSIIFRSVLSGSIQKFDVILTKEHFLQLIIVRTLDSVAGLLEFNTYPEFEDQSALLATKIHHLRNLQIFK